jgi:hypothetical protein
MPDVSLWSLPESARRIGVTERVAQRVLNSPAAFLDRGRKGKFPLFSDSQIKQVIREIGKGSIRVQIRSLRGPKFGAHISEARHYLASDQSVEDQRVSSARRESEFFAQLL